MSLQELIAAAYGELAPRRRALPDYRIDGGPGWLKTDRFDIAAKVGGDGPQRDLSPRQKLLMLQTLLVDRFRLAVHHETRQLPIYALVLARSDGRLGQGLQRSTVDCDAVAAAAGANPPPPPDPDHLPPCMAAMNMVGAMHVRDQTMTTVAWLFSQLVNRDVVDRTGLGGAFNFDLQFSPEGLPGLPPPPAGVNQPPANSDAPSIFTAVQEQLGLKLDSTRGPADVLVIDSAQRPTEN